MKFFSILAKILEFISVILMTPQLLAIVKARDIQYRVAELIDRRFFYGLAVFFYFTFVSSIALVFPPNIPDDVWQSLFIYQARFVLRCVALAAMFLYGAYDLSTFVYDLAKSIRRRNLSIRKNEKIAFLTMGPLLCLFGVSYFIGIKNLQDFWAIYIHGSYGFIIFNFGVLVILIPTSGSIIKKLYDYPIKFVRMFKIGWRLLLFAVAMDILIIFFGP